MKIAVVIPCYKVKKHILNVLQKIPSNINSIYVVDDCCPENTGKFVKENINDPRVQVLHLEANQGVGGAVIAGYNQALIDKNHIAVKIDGDDQMDPSLISKFVAPIATEDIDYTKGNRFYYLEGLKQMPATRLIGNAGLSFINKLVSGYWGIMDPTNGYTALRLSLLPHLSTEKLAKRYFFESDMLFRLSIAKAKIKDIPMESKYADEVSNLSIGETLLTFPPMYAIRFFKRIFYNYFLRDFNLGSISLVFSIFSLGFGFFFGTINWLHAYHAQTATPNGTIMITALSIIVGFQTLLFFLQQDISNSQK